MTDLLDIIVEKFRNDFASAKPENISEDEHWKNLTNTLLKYTIYRNNHISPERTSRGRIKKTIEYLKKEFPDLEFKMLFNEENIEEKNQLQFPINKTGNLIINSKREINAIEKALLYLYAETLHVHITNAIDYEKNQELAMKDSLTGLYNWGFFKNTLEHELKREINFPEKGMCLVYIDLDDLKVYNNTYGHLEGNNLIENFSGILQTTRDIDTKCRIGGDEFAIIMPRINIEEATQKIKDIQNLMKQTFQDKPATISIGLIYLPGKSRTVEDAIKKVDEALYFSKNTGKNKMTIYDKEEINKSYKGIETILNYFI